MGEHCKMQGEHIKKQDNRLIVCEAKTGAIEGRFEKVEGHVKDVSLRVVNVSKRVDAHDVEIGRTASTSPGSRNTARCVPTCSSDSDLPFRRGNWSHAKK